MDWVKAGIKKIFAVNLFPQDRDLFWIDPFRAASNLEEIRKLVNEKGMKPTIDNVYALSDKGVQDAFDRIRSRRAIGKIVIDFNLKTE